MGDEKLLDLCDKLSELLQLVNESLWFLRYLLHVLFHVSSLPVLLEIKRRNKGGLLF